MQHRNLASERTRISMNQTDCAKELGVSLKLLVKYESDIDTAPIDFIKKASSYFGCSVDYLLDMTEERTPRIKQEIPKK